jgi:predicted N-acetyltransferase YhbS
LVCRACAGHTGNPKFDEAIAPVAQNPLVRPIRETDATADFDCGTPALNRWLREHAMPNQLSGASRTSVICEETSRRVIGYVTVSTAQLERRRLNAKDRRNMPDPVPAFLIGRLAVDGAHQGQGLAIGLLRHALSTALRVADEAGCVLVLVHPIDDLIEPFYLKHGFRPLPHSDARLLALRIVDLARSVAPDA